MTEGNKYVLDYITANSYPAVGSENYDESDGS
jgi:hypothetical protein